MTLNDPYVTKHLCNLYVKYIVLPIGMTSNNIIFLCSPHYKDCLRTELGIDNSLCNPIYITTTLSKEEILDNHMSVLLLLGNFIQRLRTRYPDRENNILHIEVTQVFCNIWVVQSHVVRMYLN
jgi:hypothetical protein